MEEDKTKNLNNPQKELYLEKLSLRVRFFWGWYLKDSDVIRCLPHYSMKTSTVATAHASKSNNDHSHNFHIMVFKIKSSSFDAV